MRTALAVVLGLAVLAACAAGPAGAQEQQWLQYRTAVEPHNHDAWGGSQQVQPSEELPGGVEMPELTGDAPQVARWQTPLAPGGFVWVVLDRSRKRGPYDRLFIDTDCDGKLADETVVEPIQADAYRTQFGPVKIVFPSEDGPITYHVNVTRYDYEGYKQLRVSSACWYEGQVNLAGQKRRFLACDSNCNGLFCDTSLDFGDLDYVRYQSGDELLTRFVGKYLKFEDGYYLLEVARDGSWVRFAPAGDVPEGFIRFPEGTGSVGLGGPMGLYYTAPGDKGLVRVPAGRHRFKHCEISRQDASGKTWTMRSGNAPLETAFDLAAGQEVTAPLGEPVAAEFKIGRNGKSYTFNLALKGKLGESVSISEGNETVKVKLKVANAAGDYERTQVFTYG